MKKGLVIFILFFVCLGVFSKPLGVQSIQRDSLVYEPYPSENKAVIVESEFWNKKGTDLLGYYPQVIIRIPETVSHEAIPMGGGTPVQYTLQVTEIKSGVFSGAKNAKSVIFEGQSNISTIGTLAFSSMVKMSGKLTLPASLTNLAVSAILLPNITEIEFLGATPPTCEISGDYNPWTSASNGSTPKGIKITIPEGSYDAYKAAAGIGDYFDCFQSTTPTTHTVTFKNGTSVLQTGSVAEGTSPVYSQATPTKSQTDSLTFTFTGWNDGTNSYAKDATLPAVGTSDVTYTAEFEGTVRQYAVTISATTNGSLTVNNGKSDIYSGSEGTGLTPLSVAYGTILSVTATPATDYEFDSWTDAGAESVRVTGATTIGATFKEVEGPITALDETEEEVIVRKVFRQGVLYIERGGKYYDARGRLMN